MTIVSPLFADAPPSPTVLLLHSSGSSPRQWDALAAMLAPRFRVHAVAFHGHGDRPPTRDQPRTLADDAELVLPLLAGTDGVHVVGHSYGGAVALHLATMHGAAVRSVVAYEPVLFPLLGDRAACDDPAAGVIALAAAIREALWRGDPPAAAQQFVDYWGGNGTWRSMRADRQAALGERMPVVLRHFDALFREAPATPALARLALPMLFLSGARTVTAMRRIAMLLRLALPTAENAVLPAMGHMGPLTHAAVVNANIAAFLDRQRATGVVRAYARCA